MCIYIYVSSVSEFKYILVYSYVNLKKSAGEILLIYSHLFAGIHSVSVELVLSSTHRATL